MSTYEYDFKEVDAGRTRLDKDDRKALAQEARRGAKQQQPNSVPLVRESLDVKPSPTAFDAVAESAIDQWGAKQSDVLNQPIQREPIQRAQVEHLAQAPTSSGLFSPPVQRPIHHTHQADLPFSSIPDAPSSISSSTSGSQPGSLDFVRASGTLEETQPLLQKQESSSGLSGLSDAPSLTSMEQAGESTGAAIDSAVESAKDSISKAKSLFTIWKDNENASLNQPQEAPAPSKAQMETGPSMSEKASTFMNDKVQPAIAQVKPKLDQLSTQAKEIYTSSVLPQIERVGKAYAESVQPKLEALQSKAQEQISVLKEEGWQATEGGKLLNRQLHKQPPQPEGGVKPVVSEAKPKPFRRNAYLDARMASREKPMLQQMKARGLAIWNKALDVWEGEEPVVREYARSTRLAIKRWGLELPLLALATLLVLWASMSFIGWMAFPSKPASEHLPTLYQPQFHPSTGPIQGPHQAGIVDKLKMKLGSADSALRDQIGSLKDSGAEQLRDIKARIPSVADIKSEIKEQIPSMDSIKTQIPSVDAIKANIPAMPSMASNTRLAADDINAPPHQHTHFADDNIRAPMADDINAPPHAHTVPSAQASIPSATSTLHTIGGKIVDLKNGLADRVQDRLHHVADGMQGIKDSMVGVKDSIVDRLHPTASGVVSDPAGADVLDPENHVIEQKIHGHVEERIQL